jgi:hypothetical protein
MKYNHFNRKPQQLSSGETWNAVKPGQPHTWLQLTDRPFNRIVDQSYEEAYMFWKSLGLNGIGEP